MKRERAPSSAPRAGEDSDDDDELVTVIVSGTEFVCRKRALRDGPAGVLADMFADGGVGERAATVAFPRYAPGFAAVLAHVRGEPVTVPEGAIRGLVAHELYYFFTKPPLLLSHAALGWVHERSVRTLATNLRESAFARIVFKTRVVKRTKEKPEYRLACNDEDLEVRGCHNTEVIVQAQLDGKYESIEVVDVYAELRLDVQRNRHEVTSGEQPLVAALLADPRTVSDVTDALTWLLHATYVIIAPVERMPAAAHRNEHWVLRVRAGYEEGAPFLACINAIART